MTPYRPGFPIDSIPDTDPDNPDLPKCKATYQSICVSLNWIAISTHPDAAIIMSFLDSYQGAQNHGHYETSMYALIYLFITSYFGLTYHSNSPTFTKSFIRSPPHRDAEAYADASPTKTEKSYESTS